jgi:type VI secretion system protein ImpF
MLRNDNEFKLTPSVLDRLLDYEPEASSESLKSRVRSLKEFKQSIKRDLEWLLNTRAYAGFVDEKLDEVNKSVFVYGILDFTGISAKSYSEQENLTKVIERAIANFEPRFIDVKVTLEPVNSFDRSLKFHIEANLNIEPSPEPIAFDTVLEVGSGEFVLKER